MENSLETTFLSLAATVESVHLPLAGPSAAVFENFLGSIKGALAQARGTESISFPGDLPQLLGQETPINREQVERLCRHMGNWTEAIKKVKEAEAEKRPDTRYSLNVIEFWRARANVFNTLHQELSRREVNEVRELYRAAPDKPNSTEPEAFDNAIRELARLHSEAKEHVKFLNTLERQFRGLQSDDLEAIERSLPALLNGLKLIYTISRQFKSDDRILELLTTVSNEICAKVEAQLEPIKLFLDASEGGEALNAAQLRLERGIQLLSSWKTGFDNTRENLEKEGGDRWDFDPKQVKERPEYILGILGDFVEIISEMKKFGQVLGPKLGAIASSSRKVEELRDKVRNLPKNFSEKYNFYDRANERHFAKAKENYYKAKVAVQDGTNNLIQDTFQQLRSSETTFDLLCQFIDLRSLEKVQEELKKRYSQVLDKYSAELVQAKDLFLRDEHSPVFGKGRPPVAGAVAWKRALFARIKAPIIKFLKQPSEWSPDELKQAKDRYKALAMQLDDFEHKKLEVWKADAAEKALVYLRQPLLNSKSFSVIFPREFRVLIAEAKSLDKMGFQLPKTVLNIALQEREYHATAAQLYILLEDYNSTIDKLDEHDKAIFANELVPLSKSLSSCSFSLNSLGVGDFAAKFAEQLKRFKELKHKVDEKKSMISDIINKIAATKLIGKSHFSQPSNTELPSLAKFYTSFENEINGVVSTLKQDYAKIGKTMLPQIELVITGQSTRTCQIMKYYYAHIERRIYNALVAMIMRALITLRMLLNRPGGKAVPLFKISTEFHSLKVITVPTQTEIRVTLSNLVKLLKEVSLSFPRWKPGSCLEYKMLPDESTEEWTNLTFMNDIASNSSIKMISVEISELNKLAFARLEKYKSIWEEDRGDIPDRLNNLKKLLWNQKHRFKIDKVLEKTPSTRYFEFFLEYFDSYRREFESQNSEVTAGFIRVDFSTVNNAFAAQCSEAVTRIVSSVQKLAEKQSFEIMRTIGIFEQSISEDPEADLKHFLNNLAEIRNGRLDLEFQMADLQEKYELISVYNGIKSPENKITFQSIESRWKVLLMRTSDSDRGLEGKKAGMADQTKIAAADLKTEIAHLEKEYEENGPGTKDIPLQQGLVLHASFSEKAKKLSARKAELAASEKLFGLEVSSFPALVEIEEDLKRLAEPFEFFRSMENQIEELGVQAWSKVELSTLESFEKKLNQGLRRFADGNQNVYRKLENNVQKFSRALPAIKKIKGSPHFKDSHWDRLMHEIGVAASSSIKVMTLKQIFLLKLQEQGEKVDDVLNSAAEESAAEESMRGVENYWKAAALEISEYKRDGEKKGAVIKVSEEALEMLNSHVVALQNLEGSKHASNLRPAIREWVSQLTQVQETLETWVSVQRKWMYLESIYAGNEDIRQQLPKDAKSFEGYHKTFRKINDQAAKNPNIFVNCVQIESVLSQLKLLSGNFDRSQKALSDYLASKRMAFPRFYFISDDDLLSILGSSELSAVTPHLMKLFDNVKDLIMDGRNVKAVASEQGEVCALREPIKAEGPVETWMQALDLALQFSVSKLIKEAVFYHPQMEKRKWLETSLGQAGLAADKIWWTWKVEEVFRQVHAGDKLAMKRELARQTSDLEFLVTLVRGDLEERDPAGHMRKKINTMIIVSVHQRDIVDRFVRDSVLDAREFEWECQLRFYSSQNGNELSAHQCTAKLPYGAEYQGLSGRLVITPLTDRCVMTLTTALAFKLGGAPAGPAGTGKTETVKDLAKSLGRRCVVTNCGENFDAAAMGANFAGLCQAGFWGCFDEFNRIRPEVLSVVAAQVRAIQASLSSGKKTVALMGADLGLQNTLGIFITMNPGYEGRSELPDNLKSLFRPVVMAVPDNEVICENMLLSEGFIAARPLAKKMTVLYRLSSEQLSKQQHYDFGLRPLKAVLVTAGQMRRAGTDTTEEGLVLRALRDSNLPKFVGEDVRLFLGLLADLFPGLTAQPTPHPDLQAKLLAEMAADKLEPVPVQIEKAIQLYETLGTRHSIMMVGPSGAGKSAVIELLSRSLPRPVAITQLNPKAQNLLELYGELDSQTRDWRDGLLSRLFRQANEEPPTSGPRRGEQRWLLLDGDIDAVWIENMNSVMDDSKLLTLSNGDRVRLRPHCRLIFEVSHARHASPATISRLGIVFIEASALPDSAPFRRWAKRFDGVLTDTQERLSDALVELFDKYAPGCMEVCREADPLRTRSAAAQVAQLCALVEAQLPETPAGIEPAVLEGVFLFALVWSLGALLPAASREKFSKVLRDLAAVPLPAFSPFELGFDQAERAFFPWSARVAEFKPAEDAPVERILVPTADTERLGCLLRLLQLRGTPALLLGETGASKTAVVKNYLAALDPGRNSVLNVNFSARTGSIDLQRAIEGPCDKRRPGQYGPRGGKKLVVFIDDLHMPRADKYGTQEPHALLKLLLEKGYVYERGGGLERRQYRDLLFIACAQPSNAGAQPLDARLTRLFSAVEVNSPDEECTAGIFTTLLMRHLDKFPNETKALVPGLASATARFNSLTAARLPRTPVKFHYVFNLRDVARVFQGLLRANLTNFSKPEQLLRLWKHELQRVYADRLADEADLTALMEPLPKLVSTTFGENFVEFMRGNDLFSAISPADVPVEKRLLAEVSFEAARARLIEDLTALNEESPGRELKMVLFAEAVQHILRVGRVLALPRGHALLVGVGGSGRQSVARLAAFFAKTPLHTLSSRRSYRESALREDLAALLPKFAEDCGRVLLLTESNLRDEGCLELINGLLTAGPSAGLFDEDAKNVARGLAREEARRAGADESSEALWEFFAEKLRSRLHVVICMSPAGETLRIRCRSFPGLLSATAMDWLGPWPRPALVEVAHAALTEAGIDLPAAEQFAVQAHSDMPKNAAEFLKKTGRRIHATPRHFLDMLASFAKILQEKQKAAGASASRFDLGLQKLAETAASVAALREAIGEEKVVVEQQRQQVELLLAEISEKSAEAAVQAQAAKEKSEALAVENAEIERSKAEADEILANKAPGLEVARQKVSEIKKPDLDYIRGMNNPAKTIVATVACLQILRVTPGANESEGWLNAKTMLLDSNLVNLLIDYSKTDFVKIAKVSSRQIKALDERIKAINDDLRERGKTIDQVSSACAALMFWVDAVKLLYDTYQTVKPMQDKVEFLSAEKTRKEAELSETTRLLAELKTQLDELGEKRDSQQAELAKLTERVQSMESKLKRAERLLSDLEAERVRWAAERESLSAREQFLPGESLFCAAFLAYMGPLDQLFRAELMKEHIETIRKLGFAISSNFKVEGLLSDPVEVAGWQAQGLPADELSTQNAILTTRGPRYALCVDPQQQAIAWLRRKEAKIEAVSALEEAKLVKGLEASIKGRKPLLVDNVGEEVDPTLDPLLEKQFILKGGRTYVRVGGEELDFREKEFALYLVTRLPNPRLSPEVMGKCTVVNFAVTFAGLKEQLLTEVVAHEAAAKEAERKSLIQALGESRASLAALEQTLLSCLAAAQGSVLDNEELLETLANAKEQSKAAAEAIVRNDATIVVLEEARQSFVDVAVRGAVLFFCTYRLSAISEMYEYSLGAYLEVFRSSLKEAKPDSMLMGRISNLIERLTRDTYEYVLLGMFERDRLIFSFQMTCAILEQKGLIPVPELEFLLRGSTSLTDPPSQPSWLSPNVRRDVQGLSTVAPFWALLVASLTNEVDQWKAWIDSPAPEVTPAPGNFAKATRFQVLLLLKLLRPDRVVFGIRKFISEQLGDKPDYTVAPALSYKRVFAQSNEKSPVIFILSPGADPLADVQELATANGFVGSKFRSLSLGQNMEKEAEELITTALQRGHWAMLQNCDLLPEWLKELEKILDSLSREGSKVHPDFRLWLTTRPSKDFPLGLLQRSLKVVTEPPEGLGCNIQAVASKMTDAFLAETEHFAFKPLLYVLCFFHAVLVDRRKFGKVGFNVAYDFNDSDFRISSKLLKLYLHKSLQNKEEAVPWASLKYLIAEAMYGGRVTDSFDRRILATYIDEFMGDFLFDSANPFAFARVGDISYGLIDYESVEHLLSRVHDLPSADSPAAFGLHQNSEVTYLSSSGRALFQSVLTMRLTGDAQGQNLETAAPQILKLSSEIMAKTPEPFNVPALREEMKDPSPASIVLFQELERVNVLLDKIKSTLRDLRRAINGEIGITPELENLAQALTNGFLPTRWRELCPQTRKGLAGWLEHLRRRLAQYNSWIDSKQPRAIWLAGLHVPEAFLTAMVQTAARAKEWPLDKTTLFTAATTFRSVEDIDTDLSLGCYIYGLFLEGAGWDFDNGCLMKQKPKELIVELPIIAIVPIEASKLKLKDMIKVPVYVTQDRRNAAGVGRVFDADLSSTVHPSHWILQGIAIVMNTDE